MLLHVIEVLFTPWAANVEKPVLLKWGFSHVNIRYFSSAELTILSALVMNVLEAIQMAISRMTSDTTLMLRHGLIPEKWRTNRNWQLAVKEEEEEMHNLINFEQAMQDIHNDDEVADLDETSETESGLGGETISENNDDNNNNNDNDADEVQYMDPKEDLPEQLTHVLELLDQAKDELQTMTRLHSGVWARRFGTTASTWAAFYTSLEAMVQGLESRLRGVVLVMNTELWENYLKHEELFYVPI